MKQIVALGHLYHINKIFEGSPKDICNIKKKFIYRLAIFKTIKSDIFGFFTRLTHEKIYFYENFFIFTNNISILSNLFDDNDFKKDGPFFINKSSKNNDYIEIIKKP